MRRLCMVLCVVGFAGCSQPGLRSSADSDLPSERALAAARAGMDPAITDRQLVSLLDSSDPAVRLLAIRALEARTGETLGYHYADAPAARSAAVEAWASRIRSEDGQTAPVR